MKSLNLIAVVLISSLFLLNTAFASNTKVEPKQKLGKEITMILYESAEYLDLNGDNIQTTLVVKVDDNNKLILIDSGTDNSGLNEYLVKKLSQRKVWTRKIEKNVPYYLTVKFEPADH